VKVPAYYDAPWRVKSFVVLLDLFLLAFLFTLFDALGDVVGGFLTSMVNIPEDSIWIDSERQVRIFIEGFIPLIIFVGTIYTVVAVNRRILKKWLRLRRGWTGSADRR